MQCIHLRVYIIFSISRVVQPSPSSVVEHFLSPPKRTPTPNSSHFLLISKPLAPGNHKCAFSPCRFTSSGYFMSIESYEKWSLWPASFTLLILNVHPGCGMSWDFIPFCGQIPHYMDMPHLFIYSLVDRFLCRFHFGDIKKNAAMNISKKVFVWIFFLSISLGRNWWVIW